MLGHVLWRRSYAIQIGPASSVTVNLALRPSPLVEKWQQDEIPAPNNCWKRGLLARATATIWKALADQRKTETDKKEQRITVVPRTASDSMRHSESVPREICRIQQPCATGVRHLNGTNIEQDLCSVSLFLLRKARVWGEGARKARGSPVGRSRFRPDFNMT